MYYYCDNSYLDHIYVLNCLFSNKIDHHRLFLSPFRHCTLFVLKGMEEEESKSASLNDNIDVEEEKQLHENDKSKINNKENNENYNNDNSESNILSTEKEVASVLLRLIGSDSRDSSASLKECIVIIILLLSIF